MKLVKFLFHKSNIIEAFFPTFLIYKCCGLTCFQLKSVTFKTSFWDYLGFFTNVAYTLYLLITIKVFSSSSFKFSKVLSLGMLMNYIFAHICINVYLIANFVTRRKFFELLRKLHNLDIQVTGEFEY